VIDFETLSPDAPAIILLCSSVGSDPAAQASRPLGPAGFAALASSLRQASLRPRDLLGLEPEAMASRTGLDLEAAEGHAQRLRRSGQLAFELDRLRGRGVWVITIADEAYPERLRDRLGTAAPPVLFGSGAVSLLSAGGVAIVGSRDVDESGATFTERLASAVARGDGSIVSGGARGIDSTAMRTALEAGGSVIGILPEGVERRLSESSTRSAVASGQVVLASPYHPTASFSAGAAMGRNKLIYGLADVAVIVSSDEGSGGTWAGATEALKAGWVPILVRDELGVPVGNPALIALGGSPFRETDIPDAATASDLRRIADERAPAGSSRVAEAPPATYRQDRLFE
jgi:predicted Rossmann fold nucleotide-binding protein DprA/Smf involved in DNA uptake